VKDVAVMKSKMLLPLALGFLCFPLVSHESSSEAAKSSSLPKAISRFYDGYSFVSSFTTRQERSHLRACLKGRVLPGQPGYTRLKKILDLMKELQVQVQSIDPKMVLPHHPAVYIDYSGVVEIKSVAVLNDKATVHLIIHGLEPEATTWLISQYEKSGGDEEKIPSFEKRLDLARASTFRRGEIHVWTKFKSGWKKSEVNLVLLKN
jgi:hypothetical protein